VTTSKGDYFCDTGQTALHLAASQGFSSCCEALLSQGANVMVADSVTKATPLHVAGTVCYFLLLFMSTQHVCCLICYLYILHPTVQVCPQEPCRHPCLTPYQSATPRTRNYDGLYHSTL